MTVLVHQVPNRHSPLFLKFQLREKKIQKLLEHTVFPKDTYCTDPYKKVFRTENGVETCGQLLEVVCHLP